MVRFQNNASNREHLFIHLYTTVFPVVARYIHKRGGSLDEVKDVFQEALLVYYEKMVTGTLPSGVNEAAYLMGVSKYLWADRYRDMSLMNELEPDGGFVAVDVPSEYSADKVLGFLQVAGRKCMELLKAFYYDKLSMEEISTQFGYADARSSTVQKYKCLEKVRETVKQKSLTYESFVE